MMENVTIPNVPTASFICILVSLVVSVGLPIVLCVMVWRREKARISSFFIGAATFIVFALILEQILHIVVLKTAGTALTGNIWLYALYAGLAAGVFEETGRYLAMKLCMKKCLNKQNAIMYGAGHGGIEAILLVGMASVSNLLIAAMINSGQIPMLLSISGVDDTTYQQAMAQLLAVANTPSWQFCMAGVERVSAIIFHISASYLVYLAVSGKKILYYLLAVLAHFLLDAATVIAAGFMPVLALEALLLLATGTLGFVIWRMYRN